MRTVKRGRWTAKQVESAEDLEETVAKWKKLLDYTAVCSRCGADKNELPSHLCEECLLLPPVVQVGREGEQKEQNQREPERN